MKSYYHQRNKHETILIFYRRVYYVKRAEGLPFPSVENQMRLTISNRKRPLQGLMGAPPPVTTYLHHQFELAERKSSPSPLAVATNGSGSQPVSPLATPIPVPNSSPSSSAWSRRPLAAQSASSAPSSLIQVHMCNFMSVCVLISRYFFFEFFYQQNFQKCVD